MCVFDFDLQNIYDMLNTTPRLLPVLCKQSCECQCQEREGDIRIIRGMNSWGASP